jgi:hypothetical protein
MMELTEKDIETGIVVIGKFLSEGLDVFKVTEPSILKFIQKYPRPFVAYHPAKVINEYDRIEEDVECATVVAGTADQNNSYDLDAIFRNYDNLMEEEAALSVEAAKEKLKEQFK